MMTLSNFDIAITNHTRRIAEADATSWMWPKVATRPLRVRFTAALIAFGLRPAPTTGADPRNDSTSISA